MYKKAIELHYAAIIVLIDEMNKPNCLEKIGKKNFQKNLELLNVLLMATNLFKYEDNLDEARKICIAGVDKDDIDENFKGYPIFDRKDRDVLYKWASAFLSTKYILISSNAFKIKEYEEILGNRLAIEQGRDIREVLGSTDEVILHKSLDAGFRYVVEDAVLEVDGQEVVDIRYKIKEYANKSKKAKWIVSIGYNDSSKVHVYRGVIEGTLVPVNTLPKDSFGFDSYFIPDGSDKSLYELAKEGKKHLYSARKEALMNLLDDNSIISLYISTIPKWEGKYQGDSN